MILVTTANGNQGKLLLPKLIAAGVDVRGCVSSEESARQLIRMGVKDVIVGDASDTPCDCQSCGGRKRRLTTWAHNPPTAHAGASPA